MPSNLRKLARTVKMQGPQLRALHFDRATANEEDRTMEISFSSETRDVVRWFGIEVLGHAPEECRLKRINTAGPLLMDHNTRDQIGVIEKAWIDEPKRQGRALVRFGKSARAQEIWQDVLDGIRANVSFAYDVYKFILEEEGKNGQPDVLRAVDWEPLEISIVSVPADISVGLGRSLAYDEPREVEIYSETPAERSTTMKRCSACGHEHQDETCPRCHGRGLTPQNPPQPTVNADQERANERSRIREIQAVGEAFRSTPGVDELCRQFVENGRSVEAFQAAVLEKVRGGAQPTNLPDPSGVEVSERENAEYSIRNAILIASGERTDGIEMEIHREFEKKLGRSSNGIFVPLTLRSRGQRAPVATAASTATSAAGGAVIDTTLMPLIEILRNKMMTRALGARVLSGLVGNLSFPKQIASAVLSWVAENPGTDVSESDLSNFLGTVAMGPKAASASTAFSRQLLAQASEDVEMLIRDDLAAINALGLDLAAINGSGSGNEPRGILNTSGIGSVVCGDPDGGAPDWADIVKLETEVAVDNADIGTLAYLTNAKVRGKLKTTEKANGTGQFIWQDGREGFGSLNGYRAGVSNQVPGDLSKGGSAGILSAILFGNWNDLMIGEWGVIEIIADPYRLKKQGMIELTSFMLADVAVRRAESFSATKDANPA